MGKQSQLLLQPTEVELGLQVGVEFGKNQKSFPMEEGTLWDRARQPGITGKGEGRPRTVGFPTDNIRGMGKDSYNC